MTIWRCLLLVYSKVDVCLPVDADGSRRFVHEMPDGEIAETVDSFRCFPALVSDLTGRAAGIEHDIIHCEHALSRLSEWRPGHWWPSPDDVAAEMDRHAPPGKYDSVFILWPPNHSHGGESIDAGAWGLVMGASAWTRGATYAAVANAPSRAWNIPMRGEVWLHEWLHGVCAFFAGLGHAMPSGDADGGERHGYSRSPETGWTNYYRDLMNGTVAEDGHLKGIPREAWRTPYAFRAQS